MVQILEQLKKPLQKSKFYFQGCCLGQPNFCVKRLHRQPKKNLIKSFSIIGTVSISWTFTMERINEIVQWKSHSCDFLKKETKSIRLFAPVEIGENNYFNNGFMLLRVFCTVSTLRTIFCDYFWAPRTVAWAPRNFP